MSDLSYKNSPFRNLRGTFSELQDDHFLDVLVSPNSDDTRYLHCSRKFLGLRWRDPDVPVDSIAILKYDEAGKHLAFAPLVVTGQGDLTDFLWAPYNDNWIATASVDGTVKVFDVPNHPRKRMSKPLVVLDNGDAVTKIAWHPVAYGILASATAAGTVNVWNVEKSEIAVSITGIEGNITDINFNYDGSLIAVAAGNMVHVYDARTKEQITSFKAHKSQFPVKLHWAGKYPYIFTSGQNRYETRQICVFDGKTGEHLKTLPFEMGYSALNFEIDVDADTLYACGRGDDHIKRFQLLDSAPYCKVLTALGGKDHFRGFALAPKSVMDYYGQEVMRIYQVTLGNIVPLTLRGTRERGFYEDFFPPTRSENAALTAEQWLGGDNAEPQLTPIEPGEDTYVPPDSADEITEEWHALKKLDIVRSTSYNYITGDGHIESKCFRNLRMAITPGINRTIAGNSKFFAVPWTGNGGRLAIFNLDNPRRIGIKVPTITTEFVIHDFEFNPFNQHMIAVGGGDATVKLYNIPDEGIADGALLSEYSSKLTGHRGKIQCIGFHPTVANVFLSASIDKTIRLWDLETEQTKRTIELTDTAINFDWNYNGDQLVTCDKDRKVKIFDMRQAEPLYVGNDTGGSKGAKVSWLRNKGKIFCVGFGSENERRYNIMDERMLGEVLHSEYIDRDSSMLTPYYDEDTSVMTLWGRGDTSIKFFEIVDEAPYCHYLTAHNTLELQSGVAFLHKTLVDVQNVEIFTGLKLREDSMQPINFRVPRTRVEYFQDDIYVPTRDLVSCLSVDAFFNGEVPQPPTIDLNPGMDLLSEAPVEEIMVKKFVQGDKVVDEKDVADNTINKLYDTLMGHKEEEDDIIPGDEMSGVDSDEWGDDSSSY